MEQMGSGFFLLEMVIGGLGLLHYNDMGILKLKPAKTDELAIEGQVHVLNAFLQVAKRSWWQQLMGKPGIRLSLEMVSSEQKCHFYLVAAEGYEGYLESQLLSHYPKTVVERVEHDPLGLLLGGKQLAGAALKYQAAFAFPMKTYKEDTQTELLNNIWAYLGKLPEHEQAFMQMLLQPTKQHYWQNRFRAVMKITNVEGNEENSPYTKLYNEKLATPLAEVQLRIGYGSENSGSFEHKLAELAGTFGVFQKAEGNGLMYQKVSSWQRRGFTKAVAERRFWFWAPKMVMNLDEAASLWHLPDQKAEKVKGIDWGKTFVSEAPDDLPVAELSSDEEVKREINFFAQTEWRNHDAIFGIKREDRRKHVYIIGKTGTGKSTLIANMAINDIRNGEGVAVIDPHGDLSEMMLKYIPKRRVNDVIYLDPSLSEERAFSLNLFDTAGAAHTDVVASGIISVLYKLYYHSWGPRLEYILRNAILTLLYYQEATFADIPHLLTDQKYRLKVVAAIADKDPVLHAFWQSEFEQMNEKLRVEAISPILNKVGQFLSAQRIRHIVGAQQSTFSFSEIMDQKKVLILNLSQGKLGEDSAALLGAMFITKMQLTAMERVNMPEEQRQDFYLYVDEFQNFATRSFVKILSEARKYRLNLVLANQYIGQVEEDIQKAIFGNVGTLVTFLLGAGDAGLFAKEFGEVFTPEDLVALKNYEVILKMSINGLTSSPFVARTLPLPAVVNDNKEKLLRVTLERYYKKIGA